MAIRLVVDDQINWTITEVDGKFRWSLYQGADEIQFATGFSQTEKGARDDVARTIINKVCNQ